MLSFGEKVRRLRREKGWSQEELSKKIDVHSHHVGKYEVGKVMPNAETAVKLAKAFGVSLDYLLMGENNATRDSEIRDQSLLKAFEALDKMEEKDKEVVKSLIDAYVKKQQIEKVIQDRRI